MKSNKRIKAWTYQTLLTLFRRSPIFLNLTLGFVTSTSNAQITQIDPLVPRYRDNTPTVQAGVGYRHVFNNPAGNDIYLMLDWRGIPLRLRPGSEIQLFRLSGSVAMRPTNANEGVISQANVELLPFAGAVNFTRPTPFRRPWIQVGASLNALHTYFSRDIDLQNLQGRVGVRLVSLGFRGEPEANETHPRLVFDLSVTLFGLAYSQMVQTWEQNPGQLIAIGRNQGEMLWDGFTRVGLSIPVNERVRLGVDFFRLFAAGGANLVVPSNPREGQNVMLLSLTSRLDIHWVAPSGRPLRGVNFWLSGGHNQTWVPHVECPSATPGTRCNEFPNTRGAYQFLQGGVNLQF